MEEKIKITLPQSVLMTLKNDCKNFDFIKSDGSENFNAFINTLIVNYYKNFSATEENLQDELKKAISVIPERYKDGVFNDIIKIIAKNTAKRDVDKSVTFSFKPTKNLEKATTFIENVLLKTQSLSSFYRQMFISYVSMPQNKRETIIFKENYEELLKSIKKNVKVCLSTKSDSIKNISVYAVASAKEELFNYVLSTDGNGIYTIRLAKIKNVSVLSQKREIPQEICEIFDRQIRCGAQYPIYKGENELIRVRMSEKGKYLFTKIYLYRPTPVKIEGNDYYFDCSTNQAMHYFKRFGVDGIIVAPKKIANMMLNYYTGSAKKYSKFIK